MPRPKIKNEWAVWALDGIERGLRMFAGAYVSVVGIDYFSESFDVSTLETFKLSAGAMFVDVMFSLAGKKRGAPDSASLLNREDDPPLK
jgi:hypothetical protein